VVHAGRRAACCQRTIPALCPFGRPVGTTDDIAGARRQDTPPDALAVRHVDVRCRRLPVDDPAPRPAASSAGISGSPRRGRGPLLLSTSPPLPPLAALSAASATAHSPHCDIDGAARWSGRGGAGCRAETPAAAAEPGPASEALDKEETAPKRRNRAEQYSTPSHSRSARPGAATCSAIQPRALRVISLRAGMQLLFERTFSDRRRSNLLWWSLATAASPPRCGPARRPRPALRDRLMRPPARHRDAAPARRGPTLHLR